MFLDFLEWFPINFQTQILKKIQNSIFLVTLACQVVHHLRRLRRPDRSSEIKNQFFTASSSQFRSFCFFLTIQQMRSLTSRGQLATSSSLHPINGCSMFIEFWVNKCASFSINFLLFFSNYWRTSLTRNLTVECNVHGRIECCRIASQ